MPLEARSDLYKSKQRLTVDLVKLKGNTEVLSSTICHSVLANPAIPRPLTANRLCCLEHIIQAMQALSQGSRLVQN